MRAILTALILTIASQAGAECGKLCDGDWWMRATVSDFQAELNVGADVRARKEDGGIPLHYAAPATRAPANIQALLNAGADVTAQTMADVTPLHLAAMFSKPAQIQALLTAGVDAKANGRDGNTPWDYAQVNETLKGTEAYWALKDARFK